WDRDQRLVERVRRRRNDRGDRERADDRVAAKAAKASRVDDAQLRQEKNGDRRLEAEPDPEEERRDERQVLLDAPELLNGVAPESAEKSDGRGDDDEEAKRESGRERDRDEGHRYVHPALLVGVQRG